VIIDAGANIGLSTVFLARCYPSAKILAIEPDPSNYAQLLKNTKSIERVVPVKSALWMQDAFLRIKNLHEAQWMLQVEECSPNEDHAFRAVSISSLLRDHHIHRIDLLKLDVESSEKEIFSAHYEEWITKTKYILVELHDWMKDGCSKSLFRTISLYNFKTTIFNGMLLLENLDLA
jgi:FkbM family methyltransferase